MSIWCQHQHDPDRERVYLDHDTVPMRQVWLDKDPEDIVQEAQGKQNTGNLQQINSH